MIGGSFFPFEAMPDWMVRIGKLTPNGWALGHIKDILLRNGSLVSTGLALAALIAAGLALTWLIGKRAGQLMKEGGS